MIPEEAVEAAYEAHLAHKSVRSPGNAKEAMRAALEAAIPYLTPATRYQATAEWPDLPRSPR